MWQRNASSVTFAFIVIASSAVLADESARSVIPCSKWARFEVVLGRVTALDPRCVQSRSILHEDEKNGVIESFTLSVKNGKPSVHFERHDARGHITIDINDGDQVRLHQRSLSEASVAIEFVQERGKPLSLAVVRGENDCGNRRGT